MRVRINSVRIGHLAGQSCRIPLPCRIPLSPGACDRPAAILRVRIARRLSLRGGMRFGNLPLLAPRRLPRLLRRSLRGTGSRLGLSLRQQRLFPRLLRRAMPHLRPVLPPRRRKITILRPMKIGPGVQDRHILRRLCYRNFIRSIRIPSIHRPQPCLAVTFFHVD